MLFLGLVNFFLTAYLVSLWISLPLTFLISSSIAFLLGYFGTNGKEKSIAQLYFLQSFGFFFFLLLALNVWPFIFIPIGVFGMTFVGIKLKLSDPKLFSRVLYTTVGMGFVLIMYFVAIPQFLDFVDELSYHEITMETLPYFEVTNQEGELISLHDLEGKILIIDFWASWCRPCIEEFNEIKELVESFDNDPTVMFLFISDESLEKIQMFKQKRDYEFPFYSGKADQVKKKFGIDVLPTMIVAQNNQIQYTHQGFRPDNDLAEILKNKISALKNE